MVVFVGCDKKKEHSTYYVVENKIRKEGKRSAAKNWHTHEKTEQSHGEYETLPAVYVI